MFITHLHEVHTFNAPKFTLGLSGHSRLAFA